MAADLHNITGVLGDEYHEFVAASGGSASVDGAFTFNVDTDSAATDSAKTKDDVIACLRKLIQYYEHLETFPPA